MAGRTAGLGIGWLAPYTYAAVRIVAGLLFACHGAQKLFGVLGGHRMPLFSQMGAAGVVEFCGGLLIAIGFLTSFVAFIAAGEMAVAYFQVHLHRGTFPIQNGGELAALYCFLFLYIATRGAGTLGLDRGSGPR